MEEFFYWPYHIIKVEKTFLFKLKKKSALFCFDIIICPVKFFFRRNVNLKRKHSKNFVSHFDWFKLE